MSEPAGDTGSDITIALTPAQLAVVVALIVLAIVARRRRRSKA